MKLTTNYKDNNYDIFVEHNALNKDYHFNDYDKRIALIDESVYQQHQKKIDLFLNKHSIFKVLIPGGEQVKTMHHYSKVAESLLSMHITRNSCLFAIGGGATGDFTGFVAATLLRGIHFIQVPTTILAHDASIGGKTGINASSGKNLIGAFKRPDLVIYDLNFLDTLSQSEKLSGFAEIIKHVFLNAKGRIGKSDTVLEIMHDVQDEACLNKLQAIDKWIAFGIQTKMKVVHDDEFESGVRKYLNFGHTFGHAIEFHHKLPHGIAIMHGMIYALLLSDVTEADIIALLHWMHRLGLRKLAYDNFDRYYELMRQDKKNGANDINFVVYSEDDGYKVEQVDVKRLRMAFERLRKLEGELL
ncbi:3-dehydroquinate synthase family protein [Macrococcoides canis]|uniref:3-dehydroquinate synthase n=1 Tax=Macrococcoides canis TaxID=1855823 RepID=A0AAE6X2T6_9STAP|nr:3-dehydroquinate synthase family protein [Macrococcus canis]QCT74896.1 3-dehydroquinate synthase [Macrococcus canis]QIH78502.1 3-dehydroquinate synthase [Macrococcus canis]UTH08198.1 3-dehydroquinate synthase [Macrococcus canis]